MSVKRSRAEHRVRQLIEHGLNSEWRRIDADLIDPLVESILRSLGSRPPTTGVVAGILVGEVKEVRDSINNLRKSHEAYVRRHAVLMDPVDSMDNILAFAAELGADARQLRGDRKAFRRFFGHDAVEARYQSRHGDFQRKLAFTLERLGVVAGRAMMAGDSREATWRTLDLETLAAPLLEFEGDARVSAAAFRCLSTALYGVPDSIRHDVLSAKAVQIIYRLALDADGDVWTQSEALTLLCEIAHLSFDEVARIRIVNPQHGDDMFVRRRLVPLVAKREELADLLAAICDDPSPFVRQGLAETLTQISWGKAEPILETLVIGDPEPSVRATAVLQITQLSQDGVSADTLALLMAKVLGAETDEFALRVAIKISADTHATLDEDDKELWRSMVMPALGRVHRDSASIPARRWAAQARERIWCDADPDRRNVRDKVRERAKSIRPGKTVRIADDRVASMDDISLGRVLSVVAQDDFGFDVSRNKRGIRLTRGHRFGFRFWRFLHEIRHPSPDKRQAHRHTIGRIFEGDLRIPSSVLCEMSETKVPGEPLTISAEGGWRPYLPLVDEIISSLESNSEKRPLRIVTSEGVTTIVPPRGTRRKAVAREKLNRRFETFARLRNYEPASYIKKLRELGFGCEFSAAEGEEEDSIVSAPFAKCASPMFALGGAGVLDRMREYFYSVYENTLGQLFVFLSVIAAFFVGRHLYLNQRFKRLRRRIPLIVGGWGTRGKSGTERIKAALFNALGHKIVSKTTGCEAMFLYSPSFGKLQELFLFRPYDKATIWEQVDMVNLSARMGGRVFLWECMGLTPSYIEVLQQQWMKDDLSTIVNTYPDHEDLQGPAGIDIPKVMTYFLHRGGHCMTSEQQMTPILEDAAEELGCRMDKVGWIEPGLLSPDVLERFPYAEHPNNIALVAEMGAHMGIERDFALKEMADRVVPDLGVLKVYPVAELAGRRLQFVNGFSANERFGALGNWRRLGFDKQDPVEEPGVWVTAVVNNRADRVARSRVFASIVAKDIAVDRLFLIGTNLKGMVGYIKEAFEEYAETLTLFTDDGRAPREVLSDTARAFRLPAGECELKAAVGAMAVDGDHSRWSEGYEIAFREFSELAAGIESGKGDKMLDAEFRALLWKWFERKLVVIWDQYSTGDQTVHRICEETPPGYLNRIMGLQNIKGTGLDLVYRWQAWDTCFDACQRATDRRPKVAREGLAALSSFKGFGLLCEELVKCTVDELEGQSSSSNGALGDQLTMIRQNLTVAMRAVRPSAGEGGSRSGVLGKLRAKVTRVLEGFLDAGDAIRRRKKANQIYRDMEAERISPARAAQEIQKLNKRQKGGWLEQDLARKKLNAVDEKKEPRRGNSGPEPIKGVAYPIPG